MQCPFCKHDVSNGTLECPYCHYQFTVDAEVLSSDERDSFDGVTIEEDGSTSTNTGYSQGGSFEEEERPTHFGQREEEEPQQNSGFQMRTFGGMGCLVWLLLFIFIMIFFFVAAIKLFVAFPLLGVLALVWWLNSSYHWF